MGVVVGGWCEEEQHRTVEMRYRSRLSWSFFLVRVGLGSRSEGRLVEGGKWNVGLEGEGEGVRMDGFMVYLSLSQYLYLERVLEWRFTGYRV